MSVYSVKGKGWRYDFTHQGIRYTETCFTTKKEALRAEAKQREEVKNPKPQTQTPTDMAFLDLVNRRLDYVKAYRSEIYYYEHVFKAKKWIKRWGKMNCSQITQQEIERFLMERRKVSPQTANKEILYLKATFNYGIRKRLILNNPLDGIEKFPFTKKMKYIPPVEDINKVIEAAEPDDQDYLLAIRLTLARMNEINRLTWSDINFDQRYILLWTRKKRGGNLTPRKVPMTERLYQILKRRYDSRDKSIKWVFWHSYWSRKTGKREVGPYKDRKKIMKTLCKKANVKYFRFHALRHNGASMLERHNVPVGSIQRILGHENRTTTEIYLHSIGESERKAMDIFDQICEKSHTDSHTDVSEGESLVA